MEDSGSLTRDFLSKSDIIIAIVFSATLVSALGLFYAA